MDYSQSHIRKHPQNFNNKRLTQEQIGLLEESFHFNNKLDSVRKSQLAQELGLPPRQIAVWYQNKRARWKNQSLEVEYKTLEKKLQSALFDNQRLGREVERLKQELDKAKDMFLSFNNGGYNSSIPSISNSCDEVGTSMSLEKYDHRHLDKDLFGCFVRGEGRFDWPDGGDLFSPPKYRL